MELHFYELFFSPDFSFNQYSRLWKTQSCKFFSLMPLEDIVFNLMRDVFLHLVDTDGFQ